MGSQRGNSWGIPRNSRYYGFELNTFGESTAALRPRCRTVISCVPHSYRTPSLHHNITLFEMSRALDFRQLLPGTNEAVT